MRQVRCEQCKNEEKHICLIKKIGVKLNKSRECAKFELDVSKIKVGQETPVIKFGYKEQQAMKKRIKEEKRAMQEAAKNTRLPVQTTDTINDSNVKYPLTGDLSRFISTAAIKGE